MTTSATDYVHSRRLGDLTISAINEGVIPLPVELTVPEEVWRRELDADAQGIVPIDTHVLVIQTRDAVILIDAGLDDPGSSWEAGFQEAYPGATRTPGVAAGLQSLGIAPEDVTHILITHSHFDHVIGLAVERDGRFVPRYPNARVLLGRADWMNVPEEHLGPESRARIRAVEDAGLLDLVDGERDVVPGVTIIPAPGESPGHQIIRVSSNGDELLAVGDLFHFAAEVGHVDWMVPWASQEQMRAAREKLLADASAADAIVVFTHETFPPWGRIIATDDAGYRWQRDSSRPL